MLRVCQYLLLGLTGIFWLAFLLGPLYSVVSVGLDARLLLEILRNDIYAGGLLNSLLIALVTTALVFLIALPAALLYNRYDFPLKKYCGICMLVPMILPPFVGALGFQQILGHYGIVNTLLARMNLPQFDFLGGDGRFWSVCVIEALHLYPILYLNLIAALGNIDPALHDAARNLGASWKTRLFRITLPLLRPGLFAGGSLVLIWSFTELGTPLMLGFNRVTPVQIFNGLNELETNPQPYALVVIMLAFSVVLYVSGKVLLGGSVINPSSKGIAGSSAQTLFGWQRWLPGGIFLALTALASLPHLALLLTSFSQRWYGTLLPEGFTLLHFENALAHKLVLPGIFNSLCYSLLAMTIAVAIGVLTSLAAIRWKLRASAAADLLAMLPLAVPGIVIAFGFLGMSVKYEWAGRYFNPVENPLWLLAVAYAVRRIPYVVRSVSAGLEQTPQELENAARTCGAGAWRTFRRITLPLIMANLVIGMLFAFSFSMLEVSDSLILAQKSQFFPITRVIFELSQILGAGPYVACAFGVWAMLFLAATLITASVFLGNKIGSIFRL